MAFYEFFLNGRKERTFETYEEAMRAVEYHERMQDDYDRVGQYYRADMEVIEKTSECECGKKVWRNTIESPEEKVQRLVHEFAQKKGISDVEYIMFAQDTINKSWEDPKNAVWRALLFPNGKPTVAEFLLKIGDAANSI